jgi:hypothetical protein
MRFAAATTFNLDRQRFHRQIEVAPSETVLSQWA